MGTHGENIGNYGGRTQWTKMGTHGGTLAAMVKTLETTAEESSGKIWESIDGTKKTWRKDTMEEERIGNMWETMGGTLEAMRKTKETIGKNIGKIQDKAWKPWRRKTLGKTWGSNGRHGENIGNHGGSKPWENMGIHGKNMGKPWGSHGEAMGKTLEIVGAEKKEET